MEARYAARRDWPVERLVENLAALLTVRRRRIARQRITFLDTFDGRVVRAGACLTSSAAAGGNHIQWQQGDLRLACPLAGSMQFAWDLPQGPVRKRIEPIVEMRRLFPIAEVERDGISLDVMDETRKTVARLDIVAGRARSPTPRSRWQALHPFLTLKALRGYDDACVGPIAILESRPGIERTDLTLQRHVLQAIGADEPHDVALYAVALEPTMRADVGARRMLRELSRIVGACHAGVLAGLDSQFLHDFRVGVRRSCTLLECMQGVLPQAEVDRLKTQLSWLAGVTAPARDLDVLLLGLRCASNGVHPDPRDAILMQLEQERAAAHGALTEHLTSDRYRQLVSRWSELLSREPRFDPADGWDALPLVTVVSRHGLRCYRRALAAVERVHGDTPAHELRQIRTEVNELGDLIDATASLYDAGDRALAVGALKPLQSVLGEYDRACMKARWLREYAAMPIETQRDAISVRRAADTLADRAVRRAKTLRKGVNLQLLRFGEPANRRAFERVFHIEQPTELVQ